MNSFSLVVFVPLKANFAVKELSTFPDCANNDDWFIVSIESGDSNLAKISAIHNDCEVSVHPVADSE